MARLWSSGAELQSVTAAVEATALVGTGQTISTAIKRSGAASYRVTKASAGLCAFSHLFSTGNLQAAFFVRMYFYVTTRPATLHPIVAISDSAGNLKVSLRHNTDGTLQLYNEEDGAQVGSSSAALSTGTWYRLELGCDTTTLATTAVEAKIDGTTFASGSINLAAGVANVYFGGTAVGTTYDYHYDDIAINNGSGSFQNTWPGAGSIIHLRPNAAGDTTMWSGTFADIDETTPDDVTTIISAKTLDDETFVSILDTPNDLGSTATVNLVSVGVRFRAASATDPAQFKLQIRPSSGGATEQSAAIAPTNTTFRTNSTSTILAYPLTLYDLPLASTVPWNKGWLDTTQIGPIITTTGTNNVDVSAMWLLVDYIPVAQSAFATQDRHFHRGHYYHGL